MRGLLCRLKQWWQAMVSPEFPEMASMRREIRHAVHTNRNLTHIASAENIQARKASNKATEVARDAIARLEAARKGGDDGPRSPTVG